jgi:hypothetical protein
MTSLVSFDPSVELKAIEGDALGSNRDFREMRPHLGVEPVAVHTEIRRRVTKPHKPWK